MNREDLSAIWTPVDFRETEDDLRRIVMAIRAVHAPEFANAAPVIDIRTRERIA